MITIAPAQSYAALPRTTAFVEELHAVEYELIPAAMSRINLPELRDAILISTANLATHVARLKAAISSGEPDNAQTESALLNFMLLKDAVEFWSTASPADRHPVNHEIA